MPAYYSLKVTFNIGRLLPLVLLLGAVLAALGLAFSRPGLDATKAGGRDAQHLVALLQYLGSDYPAAVASQDPAELAEQRALSAEAVSAAARLREASRFASRVASINARVARSEDPNGVRADCATLADDVVAAAGLARAPAAPPDLTEGARLFKDNCAACHGASGHGDGLAAAALKPRPADFHSDEVMSRLTPFKAFNVIRFGVNGTAMAPIPGLDEAQQWALAFYVFTLRQPPCDHPPRGVPLDELANQSDGELADSKGAAEVACLRRKPPQPDAPALVAAAQRRVHQAEIMAAGGDLAEAEAAVVDAYLSDVEPVEPWLRAHNPDVVSPLEASFVATRAALQQRGGGQANAEIARLSGLLDRASGGATAKATAVSAFWFALLVIVREGFEAAVIIAALLAVVKKRKQFSRARFIHAGWLSALAVGAVVFTLGRSVLAGAANERLEGCLALVAAAMLLHAALWLNAKTTTRRTMGKLRGRTQKALDRGALALYVIAFLAMFRESFETSVFLEALSIDAPSAVLRGAALGAILLLSLIFAVSRLGLKLPMTTLFKISTVVLVATAVVLIGQGIHSFEEVGVVSSRPMPFPRLELLGVYPDRIGVFAQLAVALVPLLWKALQPAAGKVSRFDGAPHPGE
jgi:high-affinity iron transporter